MICLAELQCRYLPSWSYHTQFWLPVPRALHQPKSRSDLSSESESHHCRLRLTSSSSVQKLQSRYKSKLEPYLSKSWASHVTWLQFGNEYLAFQVSSCQAESIASLNSPIYWVTNAVEAGTISSSNIKATVSALHEVQRWTSNRMAGMLLDPFKIIFHQRLFVFKFPAY